MVVTRSMFQENMKSQVSFLAIVTVDREVKLHLEREMKVSSVHIKRKTKITVLGI